MPGWRLKYRAILRRFRKRHRLKFWVHGVWLLPFLAITWFYYDLFDLVAGFWAVVYFMALQVIYFYVVVFVLLPVAYYVKRIWLSVVLQVLMLIAAFILFALIMLAVSVGRGLLIVRLDFSGPFVLDIVNFGEMAFLYMGFAPVNALSFFYVERFLIKKRKVRRLWLWHHDAYARISVLNPQWLAWQMQPHLQANLMITLRDAARSEKPEKLVRATTYVSNLMTFYLRNAGTVKPFLLKEEISQVKLLLAIHKLAGTRGGAARHIRLVVDKVIPNVPILPMTILVLVENILCHATRIDRSHPATLEIVAVSGGVRIYAENAYDPQSVEAPHSGGNGVALHNIKQRLRIVHPEASLHANTANGRYQVIVFIPSDFISLP